MKARHVLVLQHAKPDHLGLMADSLKQECIEYTCLRSDLHQRVPDTPRGYRGLVVLGGPQSVYEEDQYPYLKREKVLIRRAIESDIPVLGICLGSQLLAEVLGSRVHPGDKIEIGWKKPLGKIGHLDGLPASEDRSWSYSRKLAAVKTWQPRPNGQRTLPTGLCGDFLRNQDSS